ncbi:hypothetical protein [Kutzneria sp. NPDC051319]|uniref:hypothetical protein n=1 Tax=Kutzneria sp. NPDC051319 TaxID=3155047 RepID=UPI0034129F31
MSEDLFGNTIEDTSTAKKPPKVVNNMETIKKVLEYAISSRPYVLIGPTGQPHRLGEDGIVRPLIFWEADALHQLITKKLVTVGGNHRFQTRYGEKTGQSVLVPRNTRIMLSRWNALKPLPSNGNATRRSA